MVEINPEDRYQIRKMQMDADKRALELRRAQQDLDRFVLELEHKYGLIAEEKTVDPVTATVKEPITGDKRNGNGKGHSEALMTALAEEAVA